jgi:hypothetical protein
VREARDISGADRIGRADEHDGYGPRRARQWSQLRIEIGKDEVGRETRELHGKGLGALDVSATPAAFDPHVSSTQ